MNANAGLAKFWLLTLLVPGVAACGDDATTTQPEPFAVKFAAMAAGRAASCTSAVSGLGPAGNVSVGLSDLRFYVSNLRLLDAAGAILDVSLDADEFQYTSPVGSVALVDLTSNTEGSCADSAIAGAEGTERTHDSVTGSVLGGPVAAVAFDVGVPQALMQETIADFTPEGAPSPLDEMYWNWASGYRHFVMNFTVSDDADDDAARGEGYIHVGSRDCGPEDGRALEDRSACDFINTPSVLLSGFDPASGVVAVDLGRILEGLDFVAPIYDTATFDVIGEGPGVECHSSPTQPDCGTIFGNLGLDMNDGAADPARNGVFTASP